MPGPDSFTRFKQPAIMVRNGFLLLLSSYFLFSYAVYNYGSESAAPSPVVAGGMAVWQKKNCQACHQLYGLGGYMGPDLTNIISDPAKGPSYAAAFITSGTARMPDFKLSKEEVNSLIAYLEWVDRSGVSRVPEKQVTWYGNYNIDAK